MRECHGWLVDGSGRVASKHEVYLVAGFSTICLNFLLAFLTSKSPARFVDVEAPLCAG